MSFPCEACQTEACQTSLLSCSVLGDFTSHLVTWVSVRCFLVRNAIYHTDLLACWSLASHTALHWRRIHPAF